MTDIRYLGGEVEIAAVFGKDVEHETHIIGVGKVSIQFSPELLFEIGDYSKNGKTVAELLDENAAKIEAEINKQVEA